MEMQGGIMTFGEKYGLSSKDDLRLQLCCEETVCAVLEGCYGKDEPVLLDVEVFYREADKEIEVVFEYRGKQYHPLEDEMGVEDEDEVAFSSAAILKNIVSVLSYSYEQGKNQLRMRLKKHI